MPKIKLKDRIPTIEIREKDPDDRLVQNIQRQKWRWAGNIAREKDNRWTKRCTESQPRSGRRDRGRPEARWMDDFRRCIMAEEGTRSEEMEDICRGLHPAVDGHLYIYI
ncbi:endonuclease-reverse transcriptase [Plakobranchus ocellatus]|uniref:Endonuclease-reverse transcriptase n=1 Tax=Plakobranchus ocellatus TaxID=259542 RepID=A0AAV3YWD0_9GAST|nr:endonuclease-reverse transcriptase [Plakobranchus ocellatus]